jgi:alpha-N-acetylglucosamine transferase
MMPGLFRAHAHGRRPALRTAIVALGLFALLLFYCFPSHGDEIYIDPRFGLLNTTSAGSPLAIATFLTGGNAEFVDAKGFQTNPYFTATRVLLYQTLHAPETKCNSPVDFVALVTANVPKQSRQQLQDEGAVVVEAEDIPLRWWIKTGVTRWKDQFSKLRLLEMTQYERILFIDADTLIRGKVDDIFHEPEVRIPAPTIHNRQTKKDEASLPNQYMFAARSDNQLTGERDHPFPPLNTDVFSAGFWIAAPSHGLFRYLMSTMDHYRRFDPHTMEQSLLNYAFRRGGPMPWRELHYKWSATWPSEKDVEGNVVSLHEKFWSTGPEELQEMWTQQKENMEAYFAARASAMHT